MLETEWVGIQDIHSHVPCDGAVTRARRCVCVRFAIEPAGLQKGKEVTLA